MLDGKPRTLASGKHFAVLSTLNKDGSIQSHPMWCGIDDEGHILINTEVHRAKFKNMQRNPTVTVLIQETGNPWSWSEVRGKVVETVTGDVARDHIDSLAKKYLRVDDYPNPIQSERVMVKIAPDRVISNPPGS
jgi:PPOX class probable F420-dependent enzyme